MSQILHERSLLEREDFCVLSRRYAPRAVFTPHRDTESRITITLTGSFQEETPYGSVRLGVGDVLLKSRTALHEDRYGPDGALQVSLVFLNEDSDGPLRRVLEDVWSPRSGASVLGYAATIIEAAVAGDASAVSTAASDIAAMTCETRFHYRAPPTWLERLREEAEQVGLAAVDVGERARQAGVHPVHASRMFRECYGSSLTDHAQLHAVRRAIDEMAAGSSLSSAAVAAGFYDQSHMSRVFRRIVAATPGRYRGIWARAAC